LVELVREWRKKKGSIEGKRQPTHEIAPEKGGVPQAVQN